MRLADLPRLYAPVPVAATPAQRSAAPVAEPAAASGMRWGGPSAFSWSTAAALRARRPGVSIEPPAREAPAYMRIIDADLRVSAECVKIRDAANMETWIEIDRVTRMAFHYTEFPPKPDAHAPQPSLTTYYDLAFSLHPPEGTEAP